MGFGHGGKIQMAYQPTATIFRVVDAVHYGHMGEIKWRNVLNTRHIHAKLFGIRPSLVEGVNAANRAKIVFCLACVKPVFRQLVLALKNMDA